MGRIHISPEERLKRIMGNPSDAILKQGDLSDATYPLLVSYLEWLRRLNGVHNKNDVIRQNEQIFNEFIHLCEHNLLFFLTVTGRFDVIRKLFTDKGLLTKEMVMLFEIEKEQAKATAAHLQNAVFVPRKKESSILQQAEELKPHRPPLSEWEKSLFGLKNMDLYQYYEAEIKRITHVHHMKHIKLLDDTYDEHMMLMRKALEVIIQDEHISEEKKQKAIAIYQSLLVKKEEMEAEVNALVPLGERQSGLEPLDIEILEKQCQIKEDKLKEALEVLDGFFEEIRHESPQVQMIYEEHLENISNFKKESQVIHIQWEQEMQTLSAHYENARVHALDDLGISLDLIIEELQKCPVDELEREQVERLDAGVIQLKKYKEELKKAESHEDIQLLLSKCNKELEIIASIVQSVLPEEVKKRFEVHVNLMKQMSMAPPKDGEGLTSTIDRSSLNQESLDRDSLTAAPNPMNAVSEKLETQVEPHTSDVVLTHMAIHQVVSLSDRDEMELETHRPDVKSVGMEMPADGELPQAAPLPEKGGMEVETHKPDVEAVEMEMPPTIIPDGELPQAVPLFEKRGVELESRVPVVAHGGMEMSKPIISNGEYPPVTSLFEEQQRVETKLSVSEREIDIREHQPIDDEENSQNAHRYRFFMNTIRDGTALIEFDPEKQRNYESALKELSSILSDLQEEVEPEVSAKIKEIEGLIKGAKLIGFNKANPIHIQKICEACDLGIEYEPLNHVKNSLSSMIQLKTNSQNSVGM
ncbi:MULTISPECIES: hypothetical protein [Legionella]|uniref:hypothetical protein n=1 Tax=Legionella TaxID=445 RepID=UPI000963EABE|nr:MULTISPECIES: hypothetical protein [Legionella]MBN9229163.1 hypothetical protein [Legionella steelei]OJW14075.1 MAG: hypothetical protein BGO44_08985 [Legionella sp. 39-23]